MKKGILVIVSGFSGAGKGTVMKSFMEKYSDKFCLSVSATTRLPREGEIHGQDYFFKKKEEFEQMIAEDALLEYACYVGNYYGTPRAFVESKLDEGMNVLLEIEIQGALKVKEKIKDTPILLLDDVLSELDSNRQTYLLDSIHDIQTLITCTGLDDFVSHQFHINKVFKVVKGEVFNPVN